MKKIMTMFVINEIIATVHITYDRMISHNSRGRMHARIESKLKNTVGEDKTEFESVDTIISYIDEVKFHFISGINHSTITYET